jgi:hypothetical protein
MGWRLLVGARAVAGNLERLLDGLGQGLELHVRRRDQPLGFANLALDPHLFFLQ